MTATAIDIGRRRVGLGSAAYIVAEIGINHNGDLDLATRTIEAAHAAGADAVKFQNYRTEDFISDRSLTYAYGPPGSVKVEAQYDLFKRNELDVAQLAKLREHCARVGIGFHSTPTSEEGIQALVKLGVPVLKNGSDYLTHLPLVRAMGRTGLPTVISTGMATLAEVDDAVREFRATGNTQVILLHCTSAYPTPMPEVNLRRVRALASAFGCLSGFSDHTEGASAAIAAATLGACWIEKHFTLDKALPGPDHRFSADPAELRALVAGVRGVEQALGTSAIGPTASEVEARRGFRLSCVAARPLRAGHAIALDDLAYRRPGTGHPPKEAPLLVGRTLGRDVPAGHVLAGDDFER